MLTTIRTIAHSLRARLIAAVLLFPLVALATATSGVGLRCRITGEALSACCCPGGDDAAKPQPLATVSEADCCDRVVRNVTTAPAELSAATRVLPDQATPIAILAFSAPATNLAPAAHSSRPEASANIGPPTVRSRLVAKSSFLI